MNDISDNIGAPAESPHLPGEDALKIFISYSRADMPIAERVVDLLQANGFDVKIDVRDLPYGEEWQVELADFIANSDTVVWLVSPNSVKSKWCNWELGEVGRLSKRLVPVRVRPVDPAELPKSLGRINLLPNRGIFEPGRDAAALVGALNSNRAWIKRATALGDTARNWLASERDGAHLLRGRALSDAERWSTSTPRDTPAPASEILELVLASRRSQQVRRRAGWGIAGVVAAGLLGLGWFGQTQARNAQEQQAISEATAAQRRNEVARKLLESESQIGAAIGNLSVASPDEAPTIGLLQGAWTERLVPIRDLVRTAGPQLWMIGGKQVLSAGDRLASYDNGMIIGYAAVSPDRYLIVDSVGRILTLDSTANVVDAWQWDDYAPAGAYGKPLPKLDNALELGGFSRLNLYKVGDGAVLGIGTIEATYAGGEEPRGIFIDAKNGVAALVGLSQRSVEAAAAPVDGCQWKVDVSAAELINLQKLYSGKDAASAFRLENALNIFSPALCVAGAYAATGELTSNMPDDAFIRPAGRPLALPVLRPEPELWRKKEIGEIERTRWAGSLDTILPLDGGYDVKFLPEEDFYAQARFRGASGDSLFYTRWALEQTRTGDEAGLRPADLKIVERNGHVVVAGMHYDKWKRPEVCWFDKDYVVESCYRTGDIYDVGGGMFLSRDGRYLVIAASEMMGSKSISLIDLDNQKVITPLRRSGETVLDVYRSDNGERLVAADASGVVWTYSLPGMELVSTYDLEWPESDEGAFKVGARYLDFSSQGVVRLLDAGQQTPAWIATPFEAGAVIAQASLSSDGQVLLAVSQDQKLRVLDTRSGMPITSVFQLPAEEQGTEPGACNTIEHDQASQTIELSCDAGVYARVLKPSGPGRERPDASTYALDSQTAAEAFFSTVPAFDLGGSPVPSTEEAVVRIKGTLEQASDVNDAKPQADPQ